MCYKINQVQQHRRQRALICICFSYNFQGTAYSSQGPVQPYAGHVPNHVTSAPYQPTQLSQAHAPPQAPMHPPSNVQQAFPSQQQPPMSYQQIPYQQGIPAAPPDYPSQSAPQDYYAQSLTQPSATGYSSFPVQPQMVYSQQPLL